MSGAAFEGIEGLKRGEGGERYEPGMEPGSCHLDVFEALVNAHLIYEAENRRNWNTFSVESAFSAHQRNLERFTDILEEASRSGQFDAQGFLDDLVWLSSDSRVTLKTSLLDDALQALYGVGYNNLVLDLALFGDDVAATGLKGTPENPLALTVAGCRPGMTIGNLSKHVKMEVKGDLEHIGYFAAYSEFHVDGALREISSPNSDCNFYLRTLAAVEKVGWPWDCRFFLQEEPDMERMPENWERLFEKRFDHEVYIADCSGGWTRYVLKGSAIIPEQKPWWRFWERRGGFR